MPHGNGLIIQTTPGLVMPEQYVRLAFEKFPTFMGGVTQVAGPALEISTCDEYPTVEEFMEFLERDKDLPSLLFLYNSKTKLTAESQQPFVFVKDAGSQPVLCGMMEGDYFSREKETPHSEEYHVARSLAPQLQKIFDKIAKGDIDMLDSELDDKDLLALIDQMSGNRGITVLMSLTSKTVWAEKGNEGLSGEYPWGRVSNHLGYVEKEEIKEDEKKEEPARGGRFGKSKTTPAIAIASTEGVKQEGKTIASQLADDKTKTDTKLEAPRPKCKPQTHEIKKGKEYLRNWYKLNDADYESRGNRAPENFKEGVEVFASDHWIAQNAGKSLQEGLKDFKAAAEHGDGKSYKSFAPVISPKMKNLIAEFIASDKIKAITGKGLILNPDDLKVGGSVAPFSMQMEKIKLEDTFRWDREVKHLLMEKCLGMKLNEEQTMPIILAWEEAQRELMKLLQEPTGDTKAENEMTTTEKKEDPAPANASGRTSRFGKKAA